MMIEILYGEDEREREILIRYNKWSIQLILPTKSYKISSFSSSGVITWRDGKKRDTHDGSSEQFRSCTARFLSVKSAAHEISERRGESFLRLFSSTPHMIIIRFWLPFTDSKSSDSHSLFRLVTRRSKFRRLSIYHRITFPFHTIVSTSSPLPSRLSFERIFFWF